MKADEWNRDHQPGEAVIVKLDDGTTEYTKTRSIAWDLGDHTSVVLLKGRTGGYALDRVTPVC